MLQVKSLTHPIGKCRKGTTKNNKEQKETQITYFKKVRNRGKEGLKERKALRDVLTGVIKSVPIEIEREKRKGGRPESYKTMRNTYQSHLKGSLTN